MKYVYAVAVAAAVSFAVNAIAEPKKETVAPPPKGHHILPPLEYDYPYQGKLTIERVQTIEELQRACNVTKWALGCSRRYATSCWIALVADNVIREWGWTPELMMRHEMGHCNGWGGDHAGQRPYWEPAGAPPTGEAIKPVWKVYPKPGKDESRFPAQ